MKRELITKTAVIIELEKPMYGDFYSIRDKYLRVARDRNLPIVAKTKLHGTATFNWREWVEGSEKIKMYSKFSTPMIMYKRSIGDLVKKRNERKKKEKIGKVEQLSVFNGLANLSPERFNEIKQLFQKGA